ncbi:MAG: GTPase HflX [Acholeplasmataceae bacterium]
MDKALLVGLNLSKNQNEAVNSLTELKGLAEALNIAVVDIVMQNTSSPTAKYYIGSGKVAEIKMMIDTLDIDIVIFDDTLSPAQLKNLEKALDIQIIDRSFLILSIFAERAQTKEAVLEVSLAQKSYLLPRLVGMGKSLSRQGGGTYNAKGPGETKLELDRRRLLKDISRIKLEIAKIEKERHLTRQKRIRNEIPVVALVGYTNAGKSSLMNSLSLELDQTEPVIEKDMLFTTLGTKAKWLKKDNYPPFILIDTVGFISKLPHELVRSFESTLSDVTNADLLLHVVDGADFNQLHIETTKNVLDQIGAREIERLLVLTKKEIAKETPRLFEDYLFVSNRTKESIPELVNAIYTNIFRDTNIYSLHIPFDRGNIFSILKENYSVFDVQYLDNGIHLRAILTDQQRDRYRMYIKTAQ